MVRSHAGPGLWLSARAAATVLMLGGPTILLHLCDYVCQVADADSTCNGISWQRDLCSYELFAGSSVLTGEFRKRGSKSQWMDILHRPGDDFTTVQGFLLSIRDTLRIRKGGLLWCWHPCGPFVWVSSGTHWRHLSILGDDRQSLVQLGNKCCARFALLAILCIALQIHWVVEQPSSSSLIVMPYIQHLINAMNSNCKSVAGILFKRFWLGLYGHPTPKASWLLGTPRWINELNDYMSQSQRQQLKQEAQENGFQMVKKYKDSQGVTRVCGGPSMKESAHYPSKFAAWVVDHQLSSDDLPDVYISEEDLAVTAPLVPPFDWHHAELGELRQFLQNEIASGRYVPTLNLPL